jgi:hypothetical protein
MTQPHSILLIGIDPDVVDYTQEGAPPNAEFLKAAFQSAKQGFERRGASFDLCMIRSDATVEGTIEAHLAKRSYDCILIGGGIRRPEYLVLFETVVNIVHSMAPAAAIAFYPVATEIAEAVTRVLSHDWPRSPA